MLRVGTSGFSFEDWRGPVYPPDLLQRDMLSYYERALGFDIVELNYTYYQMPNWRASAGLLSRTSPRFLFTVKCHRSLTHDLWDYPGHLAENGPAFDQFVDGLKPLREAGRVVAVLAQFPPTFTNKEAPRGYVARCRDRLGPLPLTVEFRHRSWLGEDTVAWLRRLGVGYCCVDEPPLPGLLPFVPVATSPLGYVRLHGRSARWFSGSVAARYDYHYSEEELSALAAHVRGVATQAEGTVVFFNNCHAGAAALNARRLKELLGMAVAPVERQPDIGLFTQEGMGS